MTPNVNVSEREKLKDMLIIRMGGGLIGSELTDVELNLAINRALKVYRQRSARSVEEAFTFMDLQPSQQMYTLPESTVAVLKVYRSGYARGFGKATVGYGSTSMIDPFVLASTNVYSISGMADGSLSGRNLSYELYYDYMKLCDKQFGAFMTYLYNEHNHQITFSENIKRNETILLQISKKKEDDDLISDVYSGPWIEDWSLAECKEIVGLARRRFSSMPGPNGTVTLDGTDMINDSKTMKERLINEIKNSEEGNWAPDFFYG